ncbi:hypothetical protein V473_04795 [Sphingobium cupriresistens LL01]|uniref:Uncharacterized protein n=1 Tax=Sphingobium cupriresistens LL01 TaxID=1420583 RepID=A0A0J8AX19_9SPHN|nr:hypothetical protein V473_04795 [Sphingobium cupriresistens LL01]
MLRADALLPFISLSVIGAPSHERRGDSAGLRLCKTTAGGAFHMGWASAIGQQMR